MRAASTHDPRSELRSRARGRRSALPSKGILAGAASGFCLYSTSCRAGCCSAPWWSHGHVFYTHGPEMTVFRTVFCRYDSACEKLPLKCLALQVKSPLASRASSSRGGIPCRECSPPITYFCSTLAPATSRAEKKKHSAFESFIFIII